MSKRFRIVFIILIVAIVGVIAWQFFHSREPVYKGKPASAWLADLDDQHPGPKNDQAEEAIRQIGRDALPQIISMIATRDSSLKQRIKKWAIDRRLTKSPYTPSKEINRRGVLACFTLGPEARPAIPALVALLNEGSLHGYVGAALGRIGPEAIVPMISALTNRNDRVRTEVAHALGNFPTNAPMVVPALVRCLKDQSPYVRCSAASSLGQIGQQPDTAIPALVDMLKDGDSQVRWVTCLAIGKFKKQAQSTAPLFTALKDPVPSVRVTAAIALVQIEPENTSTVTAATPFLIEALEGLKGPKVMVPLNFRETALQALPACGRAAQPAVPALLKCLKASDQYVREYATNALKAIDPEAAANAGVK